MENPLNQEGNISLAELFLSLRDGISKTSQNLEAANKDIQKVNLDDLPEEIQTKFMELKEKLPVVDASLKIFRIIRRLFSTFWDTTGQGNFFFSSRTIRKCAPPADSSEVMEFLISRTAG